MKKSIIGLVLVILWIGSVYGQNLSSLEEKNNPSIDEDHTEIYSHFLNLLVGSPSSFSGSLKHIKDNWQDEYIVMTLEVASLTSDPQIYNQLFDLLEKKTRKLYGVDINKWFKWLWTKDETILDDYGDFKSTLYAYIDKRFDRYFKERTNQSEIRLDEVRWGGVKQDGIPPLRYPKMIPAHQASYLKDDHVVFGIEVNGDVRAYPKRILAWHEMFVDEVGGVEVAGVYCTLCGTVILYDTEVDGVKHNLGTSGFLYRSNKLMYDKATQSLWNTVYGEPVIGPLVGKGIELTTRSVVTTTWGEWKKRHPDSQVLSLDTGHRRDYGEGAAYRDYFATDDLMFEVPGKIKKLKNKDEVLIIRAPEYRRDPLAIAAKYLRKRPIYHAEINGNKYLVLTDVTGGNRVYDAEEIVFMDYDGSDVITDQSGRKWYIEENELIDSTSDRKLSGVSHHRSFWFGWVSMFPETRLIK